jgi:tetratricopeptide (TPR) repeat protein
MNNLAKLINRYGARCVPALILGLAIGLAALANPVSAQNNANEAPSAVETEALNNFETAKAAGRHAEATKYILDYMVETEGENAPLTVALTTRYGNLLRTEGDIREAITILKKARERGIIAYGEYGIEMFGINLDLGEAYVERDIGIGKPQKYYDDALEVMRKNGQHETTLYVTTLVGIASRLTQAGALGGAVSVDTAGVRLSNPGGEGFETLIGSGLSSVTHGYASGYRVLEEYIQEAVELAEVMDIEDPYLTAKVSIVESKIKVIDSLYLEVVPASVRGSVSGATIRESYQQEDDNLSDAIDVLMGDTELNQGFLDIANSARMDIAWLSKDMERLANFCSSNTLNIASKYTPDRLYEIEADGTVIAPGFSFRVSTNIFRRKESSRFTSGDINQKSEDEKKPIFVPVCINGRLMAALTGVPMVTIEEIRN